MGSAGDVKGAEKMHSDVIMNHDDGYYVIDVYNDDDDDYVHDEMMMLMMMLMMTGEGATEAAVFVPTKGSFSFGR